MSADSVVINFIEDCNQKCYISPSMISFLNGHIGDYVLIRSAVKSVVCKIFVKHNVIDVQADDTVSLNNYSYDAFSYVSFPEDFCLLTLMPLNRIKISIVFRDYSALINWESNKKIQIYVKAILLQYGIISKCEVNCRKHNLGSVCGISEILVLDTYLSEKHVGKIDDRTIIDVQSISPEEFLFKLNRNSNIQLGGFDNLLSSLTSLITYLINTNNQYRFRMLLKGPPGCGKSSLVKKIAQTMNIQLISLRSIDLCRMSVTECKNFFDLVKQAGQISLIVPHILLIDDIDSDISNNKERAKCLYLTLYLLDICRNYGKFFIFGATNSSKPLSHYLKSPTRFIKQIYIGVPTFEQRESILQTLTSQINLNATDIKEIARETPGYVGSDLSYLAIKAESIAHEMFEADDNEDRNDSHKQDYSISIDCFRQALKMVKPSLLKNSNFIMDVKPTFWDDIGGLENIKKRVKMYIEWPVLHPAVFSKVGLPCPKGVLLFGPPGCCKTTLVRVLATECKATFLSASPAQIYSSYVGDSEKSIIELFRQARLCAPSIVFLDEIESLVGKRSYVGTYRGIQEKVLSTLLNEMDGFGVKQDSQQGMESEVLKFKSSKSSLISSESEDEVKSNENVLVVGATNRIDLIDDALLRPGRFDTILYVPPPNITERKAILQKLTKRMNLDDDLLDWLAEKTEYFSGADLQNVHRMAAFNAIKSSSKVCKEHFDIALNLIHPSITRSQLENYENTASRYGPIISV